MTANQAIPILELNLKQAALQMPPDCYEAVALGAEALKAWVNLREGRTGIINPLLPGETEATDEAP
ncbi:hypothetical protein ES708_29477 [subsurface metagenome]